MKETIITTDIPREKGYLYYVGTDSKGCLVVGKAKMNRIGRTKGAVGKKKHRKLKENR